MKNFIQAFAVEAIKARRSRAPLFTALGFSLAPIASGFFMVILKDPELARSMGLISTKAQIMAGTADWPAYFGMLAQAVAVGGLLLFSFTASWVFGREFSDRTMKDLLALPTPRRSIVLAKFTVVGVWIALLTLLVIGLGLLVGAVVVLPGGGEAVTRDGVLLIAACAALTAASITPVALFACLGRGYMAPMGGAVLLLILAQLVGATGWGEFFPWTVAALLSGAAGPEAAAIGPVSVLLVLATGIAGIAATLAWWSRADHTR